MQIVFLLLDNHNQYSEKRRRRNWRFIKEGQEKSWEEQKEKREKREKEKRKRGKRKGYLWYHDYTVYLKGSFHLEIFLTVLGSSIKLFHLQSFSFSYHFYFCLKLVTLYKQGPKKKKRRAKRKEKRTKGKAKRMVRIKVALRWLRINFIL